MSRSKLILAGIESAYATDPVLDAGSDAILTTGLTVTPLEADNIDRNLDIVGVGNTEQTLTAKRARLSFGVELAGSGAATDPAGFGTLLRAAAFAETIATDVTYDLIDDPDTCESIYIYCYWRGKLHKLSGARLTAKLMFPSRDLPRVQFEAEGLFVAVTEADPATPDFTAFVDPIEVGNANTTFTFDGVALELESFELDVAQTVKYVHRVGKESVDFEDAAPSGQIVIASPALATMNFFSLAGGPGKELVITHGTTAGNIVEVTIDDCQVLVPTYTDLDDSGDGLQIPLRPIGSGIHIVTK